MLKPVSAQAISLKNLLIGGFLGMTITTIVTGQATVTDNGIQNAHHNILQFADVEWGPLNPARGKDGPQAADLWGNRKVAGATGMLVKFRQGFASPPHIHNISYRGIVISGLIHNDDPNAEDTWLTSGSYWTQPAGDSHITSATATTNLAYIEIDDGPYLVQPTSNAFNNGEVPVNVEYSNIVWHNASDIKWTALHEPGTEIAFLWGTPNNGGLFGSLLKLRKGFVGRLQSDASEFRAVTILGPTDVTSPDGARYNTLNPGSYFGGDNATSFRLACAVNDNCIIYVRTNTVFTLDTHDAPQGAARE